MTQDEVPELIAYLMSNGYTINTTITEMLNSNKKLSNPDKTIINLDFPSLPCYYVSVGGYYG